VLYQAEPHSADQWRVYSGCARRKQAFCDIFLAARSSLRKTDKTLEQDKPLRYGPPASVFDRTDGGASSNGRTRVFGTRYPGSNPGVPATVFIEKMVRDRADGQDCPAVMANDVAIVVMTRPPSSFAGSFRGLHE
jgi:hypothetical protein